MPIWYIYLYMNIYLFRYCILSLLSIYVIIHCIIFICFYVNKAVLLQIRLGSSFTRDLKVSQTVLKFAKKPKSTIRKSEISKWTTFLMGNDLVCCALLLFVSFWPMYVFLSWFLTSANSLSLLSNERCFSCRTLPSELILRSFCVCDEAWSSALCVCALVGSMKLRKHTSARRLKDCGGWTRARDVGFGSVTFQGLSESFVCGTVVL